ncbi:MAG: NAD-dependent deacetylase [Sphaerochaetaceae bacterium]|jgi:NAD-dependent deacetylase|nr:NAD-dependent deacetylase [Sphaerochaetaceae bacterium]MDD3162440.1 NAD-dependent deacetylase [Sphaerochaetaceae bacterium]MDD4006776.1 NAD-dependent deacetylase [Sphaerochaetaceae bacterium]MDD4396750.1 NAD-dependent deacetylase [Sphaerochaetaceae bacterium]
MIDYSEDPSAFEPKFKRFENALSKARYIAVLTGAGVSTLSGIPDFRGTGGIYTKQYNHLDVESLLNIDFFHQHPEIFYKWAADVWFKLENYKPNIVHETVARMEKMGVIHEVFTQNIDMLHQRAGSKEVYEVHGSPMHNYCTRCNKHYSYEQIAPTASKGEVPYCSCGGVIKPDIVFYGEMLNPHTLQKAEEIFGRRCDMCIVLGSSLNVSPVNQLPYMAISHGSALAIVNAQDTPLDGYATFRFRDLKQTCTALNGYLDRKEEK